MEQETIVIRKSKILKLIGYIISGIFLVIPVIIFLLTLNIITSILVVIFIAGLVGLILFLEIFYYKVIINETNIIVKESFSTKTYWFSDIDRIINYKQTKVRGLNSWKQAVEVEMKSFPKPIKMKFTGLSKYDAELVKSVINQRISKPPLQYASS